MRQRFTDDHVQFYRDNGYAIIENFLTPEELGRAQEEIETYIPGWLAYAADASAPKPPGVDKKGITRRQTRFPFPGSQLNAITLHPELRRFAAIMMGHDNLFCEQSDLTFKCKGHAGDVEQALHLDYLNHNLAYPTRDSQFWQTTYLMYYTDVTEGLAPTAVCSSKHYDDELRWPTHYKREDRPELYEAEVKVIVPAGSLLAYSTRTFHRGTAFQDEGARVGQFISYAPANCPWLGIVGWPEQGVNREFKAWMENATPAERELLGFPKPGNPYWNAEALEGVAARFPGMDLTPYLGS